MAMKRAGVADMRLHPGRAPHWLVKRMMPMADALFQVMVDEHGTAECLTRLGDPLWFQALSNVLGYDWDSSGTTTVLCGVLRSVLRPESHGIAVAGGKGARSRRTPLELQAIANQLDLGEDTARRLIHASRMVAKVDSAALQDGYQLYHHTFFLDTEQGNWTVVQQGMNEETRTSRRYHWISKDLRSFVEEPHSGFFSRNRQQLVLDMTAQESGGCRTASTAIACETAPHALQRQFDEYKDQFSYQKTTLMLWVEGPQTTLAEPSMIPYHEVFPERMNWRAVNQVFDAQPANFEELLAIQGMGASTIRGLALLSEIVYGEAPSWQDPVRMAYAFGGKDGVPYPVDRRAYDEAIAFLEGAIDRAKVGRPEKLHAFRRLRNYQPYYRIPFVQRPVA